jgi:hypothetical protein
VVLKAKQMAIVDLFIKQKLLITRLLSMVSSKSSLIVTRSINAAQRFDR